MLLKLLFSTLALLGLSQFSHAQCIADAGSDQHWCSGFNWSDSLTLGGNPTALNGQGSYTYEWSITPIQIGSSYRYYASLFLDDTTAANPKLLSQLNPETTFYLKVTDTSNNTCYDTVTITHSQFSQHMGTVGFTINEGDSVQLDGPNVSSNNPLDSILWRPNHGLIDSNAIRPWVKPSHDIVYYAIVWDSAGCSEQGSPFQYVTVSHVGIIENVSSKIELYPSLLKEESLLHVNLRKVDGNQVLTISDLTGKTIKTVPLQQKENIIELSHLPKGTYICSILSDGKLVKQHKLIRN